MHETLSDFQKQGYALNQILGLQVPIQNRCQLIYISLNVIQIKYLSKKLPFKRPLKRGRKKTGALKSLLRDSSACQK